MKDFFLHHGEKLQIMRKGTRESGSPQKNGTVEQRERAQLPLRRHFAGISKFCPLSL